MIDVQHQVAKLKNSPDQNSQSHILMQIMSTLGGKNGKSPDMKISGVNFLPEINISKQANSINHVEFNDCLFGTLHAGTAHTITFTDCVIGKLIVSETIFSKGRLIFKGGSVQEIVFVDKVLGFKAVDVEFGDIRVEDLSHATFSECEFKGIFSVSDSTWKHVIFQDCSFFRELSVPLADFKDVDFIRCKFTLENMRESAFRHLKRKMLEGHDDQNAHLFAAYELMIRTKDYRRGMDALLTKCYQGINDYGLQPYRPLKILLGIFFVAFFFWSQYFICFYSLSGPSTILKNISEVLYLSLLSISGPLRLFGLTNPLINPTLFSTFAIWFFTAISSVLWFFLIMGVRKRFRV